MATFPTSPALNQTYTFNSTTWKWNGVGWALLANAAANAATLSVGRTIAITGDVVWTSPAFDGSTNVTAAGTLATVNSNVGSFGSATAAPTFTVNAKGLITAAGSVTLTPAFASITSKPTTLSGYGITDAASNTSQVFSGNISALNLSGTNTGDQTTITGNAGSATILTTGRTIAMTGDIVWTSPSFNGSGNVTAAGTIQANVVDNAKLAQIATATFKGRTTAGTGNVEDLTVAQAKTMLGLTGTNSGDQTITLTGDITGSGTGSLATTLATVNSNTGSFGSATAAPTFTVNAKGLITAAGSTTITPAFASITSKPTTLSGYGITDAAPINNPTFTGTVTLAADPVSALQAATKQYVDNVAQGLDTKSSVLCATTANITLSGEQTLDGVLTSASRVLVKNQTTTSQNGIYVSAAGSWTRAIDMDAWTEVAGSFVFVEQGSTQSDTGWVCISDATGTINTTAITWAQFSGAGSYSASGGVTLTGTNFALTSMAANSFKGNNTGSTAAPTDLTATQATALLDLATGSVKGLMSSSDFSKLAGIASGAQTGTVTSVSVVTANGISGSVATSTSTPAITLTLGAITPTTIVASGNISGLNLSGTNTGDQTTVSGNAGSATILATGRTLAITGDLVWTSPSFNGSGNVTAAGTIQTNVVDNAKLAQVVTATFKGRTTAGTGNVEDLTVAQAKTLLNLTGTNSGDQTITLTGDITGSGTGSFATTLATVNSNVGAFGSTTAVPIITVNGKGLITAVSTATLGTAAVQNTGTSGATLPFLNGNNTWSGTNLFSSKVTTVASATSAAGFNIPHGAAPTSPADGDMWTTTTAALVRINTATKTFAFTDSSITGSAATLTTGRTIAMTGDVAWTSPTFDGSGNVTAAGTLATVNSNTGSFGSATAVATFTVNGKGLITAAGSTTITPAFSSITSRPTTLSGYGITDAASNTSQVFSGSISATNLSGTNTGDQTITLTGNVTGSGTGSFATTIGSGVVTNSMLASVATATFKGRTTASTGVVEDLTATQSTALLDLATGSLKGLMSSSDFTKLAGIASGAQVGTVTSVSVTTANGISGSVATSTSTPAITLTLGAITPTTIVASGNISGLNLSGTNTGDQTTISGNAGSATVLQTGRTLAISGDLVWNSGSFNGSANVTAAGTIQANVVDNTKLSQIATATFKGRTTAGTGNVEDLTATQSTALLDVFTTSVKGLAPASGGGTTNFLRADGTWAAPPGGGGSGTVTSVSVTTANGISGSVATNTTTPAITLTLGAITPTTVVASGNISGANLSGTNTGDQTTITGNAGTATTLQTGRTIAMTGDVVWTSPSFNGSGNVTAAAAIQPNVVTNNDLVQVATATFKGRTTAGTGDVEDLTATQATALLNTFTTANKGLVPAPGTSNTTDYLRRDGTWATPAGGGGGGGTQNLFVQDAQPSPGIPYMWVQTNYGDANGFTIWFDDGT